jgi:hypothetical protein
MTHRDRISALSILSSWPVSPWKWSHRWAGNRFPLAVGGFVLGLTLMGGIWWLADLRPRQQVSLYWLTDRHNDLYYVVQDRSVAGTNTEAAIANSVRALIAGPSKDDLTSALPPNTQLMGVRVQDSDIFLDFSPEFASGGGATAMIGRVTQVLYTVTSANPQARVWLLVNGEPLQVLSGEGLVLEQPLTRLAFKSNFQEGIDRSIPPISQNPASSAHP